MEGLLYTFLALIVGVVLLVSVIVLIKKAIGLCFSAAHCIFFLTLALIAMPFKRVFKLLFQ